MKKEIFKYLGSGILAIKTLEKHDKWITNY